jgi:hypothetical protein
MKSPIPPSNTEATPDSPVYFICPVSGLPELDLNIHIIILIRSAASSIDLSLSKTASCLPACNHLPCLRDNYCFGAGISKSVPRPSEPIFMTKTSSSFLSECAAGPKSQAQRPKPNLHHVDKAPTGSSIVAELGFTTRRLSVPAQDLQA